MTGRYSWSNKVTFEILGSDINPDKANPLIESFKKELENFEVHDDYLKARIEDVDGESPVQENSNLVRGKWQVRWEIVDECPKSQQVERWNNVIRNQLAQALTSIRFSYYSTVLEVIDVDWT